MKTLDFTGFVTVRCVRHCQTLSDTVRQARKDDENMNAEQYLLQVRMLNKQINNKLIELEQLRTMATSTSAPTEGERVQSSGNQDKMGSMVCKIVTMEQEINAEIDSFVDLKQQVISTLEQVNDPEIYDILHMYYIQELNWKQVSDMKGYTYQWIHELKNRGFGLIQELLDNN